MNYQRWIKWIRECENERLFSRMTGISLSIVNGIARGHFPGYRTYYAIQPKEWSKKHTTWNRQYKKWKAKRGNTKNKTENSGVV